MPPNYFIPTDAIETEYEIKKSRFITRLAHAQDRKSAMILLDKARADYPDARHHCWAYLIGPPQTPSTMAMSDDGEPSGTAGKPLLNVMQHKPVGDAMLIVIRYFGGIKLGAGGLVRAYSQAAQQAYERLSTKKKVFLNRYQVQCDFSEEQNIRHWLSQNQGEVEDSHYGEQVILNIALAAEQETTIRAYLSHLKSAFLLKS